jgi:hypothetical protein
MEGISCLLKRPQPMIGISWNHHCLIDSADLWEIINISTTLYMPKWNNPMHPRVTTVLSAISLWSNCILCNELSLTWGWAEGLSKAPIVKILQMLNLCSPCHYHSLSLWCEHWIVNIGRHILFEMYSMCNVSYSWNVKCVQDIVRKYVYRTGFIFRDRIAYWHEA